MAMVIIVAMVNSSEHLVRMILEAHGWKLQPVAGGVDFLARKGRDALAVEVKHAAEGRRDRVIPLLSQAILQAQAYARNHHVRPLAVVVVADASPALLNAVEQFVHDYAPGAAAGIVDSAGVRHFVGDKLAAMNAGAPAARQKPARPEPALHLFSDLNQWMLKVLMAPRMSPDFLSAPRGQYRNASELAKAAGVSVMSAFRLVRHLEQELFLDRSRDQLSLVRVDDLLGRWRAAALKPVKEVPVRWILPGAPDARARAAAKAAGQHGCLGLFAAADALGLGHVRGAAPHLYVSAKARLPLNQVGVRRAALNENPDAWLRLPAAAESILRGAVDRDGVRAADVLQVWLDVSGHPSRGREQADYIWRRVLGPALGIQQPA